MATVKKLNMGVIGLGYMGTMHARMWRQLSTTELLAVTDIDQARAASVADDLACTHAPDIDALLALDDIEAVSIVTPDRAHVEPAIAAAKAGKHILLEKPMAHTAQAAAEIADAAERHGVRLMVAHILRFDPRYVQLQDKASVEQLGDVISMRAKRNTVRELAGRLGAGSSILYYLGVHDIDMIQWVSRSSITRVYAQKVEKLANGNEDAVYAIVTLANRGIGVLDYNWAWPSGLPANYHAAFEVVGTKSAAFLDVRDQGLHIISDEGPTSLDTHLWPEVAGEIVGDLRDELIHFADAVRSGKPFRQDPQEALDAIRVLDALFLSIEQGAPVNVRR